MGLDEIISHVNGYECNLVEITGGEPLMQDEVHDLMTKLSDLGLKVMIETGGSLPIEKVDKRVKVIMDLKTPYSKMEHKNRYENISFLKPGDEVKFVIGNKQDYEWARNIMTKYELDKKTTVLMSPVFGEVENIDLATWILHDKLNARFQIQLHKYIWHPETRGV